MSRAKEMQINPFGSYDMGNMEKLFSGRLKVSKLQNLHYELFCVILILYFIYFIFIDFRLRTKLAL